MAANGRSGCDWVNKTMQSIPLCFFHISCSRLQKIDTSIEKYHPSMVGLELVLLRAWISFIGGWGDMVLAKTLPDGCCHGSPGVLCMYADNQSRRQQRSHRQ